MRNRQNARIAAASASGFLTLAIGGCGGGGGGGGDDTTGIKTNNLEGSVIDGPVKGATVKVKNAQDNFVKLEGEQVTATTNANGGYTLTIPADAQTPLTIVSTGGTDTGIQQDVENTLTSMTTEAKGTANVTPTTTLVEKQVKNAVDVDQATTQKLKNKVSQTVQDVVSAVDPDGNAYGGDKNPITDPIKDVDKVRQVEEVVGATMRQAQKQSEEDKEKVVEQLAQDAADGDIDGETGDDDTGVGSVPNFAAIEDQVRAHKERTGNIPESTENGRARVNLEEDAFNKQGQENLGTLEASGGAYRLVDDASEPHAVTVTGFGQDDCIAIQNAEVNTYSISNDGSNVEISWNNAGDVNFLLLEGLVSKSDLIGEGIGQRSGLIQALDYDPFDCSRSVNNTQ